MSSTGVGRQQQPELAFTAFLRSAEEETESPVTATRTIGCVPRWLNGSLVYNGPGMRRLKDGSEFAHVFDGLSLLQR